MNPSPRTDEALFSAALSRPAAERAAFLDGACGTDSALRARLAALLAAHEGPESLLIPAVATRPGAAPTEKPGDRIAHYKLLEKIGEGGCGLVYVAEQEEPVRRRVALKVIKLGMDTKAVVARFEAERQALAMMDHANIAKVFDAGTTATGRPFFVMELVRGVPITKYCDDAHLASSARLELFIKVCQAVQHAHQKGIIHRDLKPSNILVTVNDGQPTPKVIDFGIAKATQGRLTDATVYTAFEQFIGTPMYMSPEQAEMSSLDIDTRSDIYSLGVLLYELLTGRPPFDPKVFAQAGVDQIRQQIREVEPQTPSRRLHTLDDDERTTIAKLRNTAPAQLSLLLRGDLDWIVMRCLEKDRTRRYDTANGLAADIQRHLRNEPVTARPPSTAYLLQKLVRRHRGAFVATAVVVGALVIGGAVSIWQAVRATQAEREKSSLYEAADRARATEAELRRVAEAQELVARQRAYAADMNLVQQALAIDNLGRARELLYRHAPMAGQRDLRDWEWRYLWQFCQSDAQSHIGQRNNAISSLSLSADGNWLAVAEEAEGGLSILNMRTPEETRVPAGDGHVRVAFSPRDSLLAVSTESGSTAAAVQHRVLLWNPATRQTERELSLAGPCRGLFFSQDGRMLVTSTCEPDNQISLWRVIDGEKLGGFPAPQVTLIYGTPFAATHDLRLAAHAMPDSQLLRVIDPMTGTERWQVKASDDGVIRALAFSPDGKTLASGAAFTESLIRLWDVASGKEIGRLEGHRSWVSALVFWPDGRTLASASADQTIRLWDLPSRRPLKTLRGHKRGVFQLSLLPGNRTLVSGGEDGAVFRWDTTASREASAAITLPQPVADWRFAADGKSVITVDLNGIVAEWKGPRFQPARHLLDLAASGGWQTPIGDFGERGALRSIHLSPAWPLVAMGSRHGTVRVWDLERGVMVRALKVSNRTVLPAAFFNAGKRLLVLDRDNAVVHDWDLASGEKVASWRSPDSATTFLLNAGNAFSPMEDRCLTLGYDGKAIARDMSTGRETSRELRIREAQDPKFSPDGRFIAAASGVGGAKLWDAATFRELANLSGFLRNVYSVAFSPDSQRLAAGSSGSESVKLWDVESHEEVLLLRGAGAIFKNTAFSADGSMIGSRTIDGILHLWRAPSREEIAAAEKSVATKQPRP